MARNLVALSLEALTSYTETRNISGTEYMMEVGMSIIANQKGQLGGVVRFFVGMIDEQGERNDQCIQEDDIDMMNPLSALNFIDQSAERMANWIREQSDRDFQKFVNDMLKTSGVSRVRINGGL